jgi:methylphosphotriester-DNA--protein-cysteine methyltransferase
MTIDAQEIDFQSIIEAGFVSQSPTSSEESNEISPLSNPTADADFHNLLTSLSAVEDSQLSMMQNTFYIKDDQAPCLSPKTEHILSGIKLYLTDEQRWQAVLKHDSMANGHFFYCVKSTGIYCRPTCPSRRPQRSNVIFHVTIQDAEKAGFRACRRCKPQELVSPSDLRQLTAVEMVKQEIESAVDQGVKQPSLASLATKAGMSSFHFHRVFKARTGITPEEYGKLVRSQSSGNSGTN